MGDWDDFGGDWDWLTENLGSDAGEWFVDTMTGDIVSSDDMQAIMSDVDYDFGDMPNSPLADSPISRSTSDILRSMEGAPAGTTTPGREAFDWNAMADPTASIASAGGTDWMKALMGGLKGLSGLMSGGGLPGLKGLTDAGGGGGVSTTGLPGIMSAGIPQVGGVGAPDIARAVSNLTPPGVPALDITRPPGVPGADLMRAPSAPGLGMQDPVSAALMRLQAEGGGRVGLQGAIDAGAIADKFNPIVMPFAPVGGGAPKAQHLSGLQRLALERLG